MAVTVHDIPMRDPDDRPWLRGLVWALVVILLVGGGVFAAYKMGIYGTQRSEEKLFNSTATVGIEFVNLPPWLLTPKTETSPVRPSDIVCPEDDKGSFKNSNPDSLMNDVIAFSQIQPYGAGPNKKALTNLMRLQNPQDWDVLRELAGYLQAKTNLHNRAWIKGIRSIKRESDPKTNTERILIDAEYREPLAFVVQGDAYLLVEKVTMLAGQKQAVRLPGVYGLQQRRALASLPCVSGVDGPTPEPGQAFVTKDAIAGLELAAVLAQQPYIKQIATINVSNFEGRLEPDPRKLTPFIVLDTVFPNPATPGEPTHIRWGRAVGDEQFFEVHTPTKLGYLMNLFARYNRIDAAQEWVDLRFDQPTVPMAKVRSAAGDAAPVVVASGQ